MFHADLPYHYSELEPVISTEIMKLHHGKHHLAYVNNLKEALRKMKEAQVLLLSGQRTMLMCLLL
jgi:Fe-Mn family superoxide dismutase